MNATATLIIAATHTELSWLIKRLPAQQEQPLLDFPVYRAANTVLVASGPGMANAAAACAAATERFHPNRIFNTGICGVYARDKALLGKAAIGSQAIFADTGAAGDTQFHSLRDMNLPLAKSAGHDIYDSISLSHDNAPQDILRACFLTIAAVSGSPGRASELSRRFTPSAGSLVCEDMESAAIALVALRAQVPCSVVRGISNLCGERDHAEWKIAEAALAAQETLYLMLPK